MKYYKEGVTIDVENHICQSLYVRYGWIPIVESNSTIDQDVEPNDETKSESKVYTKEELIELKAGEIKKLGSDLGYKITAVKQSDCVKQFLERQG